MASNTSEFITVYTSSLFDSDSMRFLTDTAIRINTTSGLIDSVSPSSGTPGPNDIDLRGKTVLPGFVDSHAHIFLHGPEISSLNQMRDESAVERILRASNAARIALASGYTTYRDLGTEGMRNADVNFRDAINRGIIPGPRMFVATECIVSSGGYVNRVENDDELLNGYTPPKIADSADGIEGVRAAVRRRVAAGADIIKVYADYRKRTKRWPANQYTGQSPILFPPEAKGFGNQRGARNPNSMLFTQEELNEIVHEAQRADIPVSMHAGTPQAVIMAAKANVTTIEHGFELNTEAIAAMKQHGSIYVPTLGTSELYFDMKTVLPGIKQAYDAGVKIAAGADTGATAHGENIREAELLLDAGLPLEYVLTALTKHGWEACGAERTGRGFGVIKRGWAADLVALNGDPRSNRASLRNVDFVMKDGKVFKRGGKLIVT